MKTQFGFHIIKVVDKKAAATRTLDEVRPQIADQLAVGAAQAQAGDLAAALEKEINTPADLDKVAQARRPEGAGVRASSRATSRSWASGPSPEVAAEAFALKDGQVSGAGATVARLRVHHA